jgi:hypothetical protein
MKKANTMKKLLKYFAASVCGLVLAFGVTGCADATGLHNQESSQVTFVFTNFPVADGDYTIPGDYNSWAIAKTMITMKDGEGTSSAQTVATTWTKFTLIKTNDSAWARSWYPTVKGNAADGSNYWNFYVDSYTMGGAATITIDGSTSPATITVK